MRTKYYLLSLLVIISLSANAASYNPWWRWAVADTTRTFQNSNTEHVLAARGGKA